MEKINVLSLFGGIECGRVAMDRLGWEIGTYYSSEFDPYPRSQTEKNFPDIVHLGDVRTVKPEELEPIDILIGGSPCQDLSIAKAGGKGLEGDKSGLFFEYVRILKEAKPKYFLLENVASMKKADKDIITEIMGVEPTLINSALVSAQNRKRYYWYGQRQEDGTYSKVEVPQPEDRGIFLRDILEDIPMDDARWKHLDEKYITDKLKLQLDKYYSLTATYAGACPRDYLEKSSRQLVIGQFRRTDLRVQADQEKTCTLTANMGTGGNNVPILMQKIGEINEGGQGNRIYSIDGKGASLGASSGGSAGPSATLILGMAHRNRGEGKQPEINGTEKANSLTTVQSDSKVACIFGLAHRKQIVKGELSERGPECNVTEKSNALNGFTNTYEITDGYYWRKLTCIECERLQTLPDGFTKDLSNSRRYKAIGNGWTVEVIKHILSFAKF